MMNGDPMRVFMFRLIVTLILSALSVSVAHAGAEDPWLLVETDNRVLKVMEGDHVIEVFNKIAIGSRGADWEKIRNDKKTPLGEYRIGWVNEKSRFHRFFGLTYPNRNNAKRAYLSGALDESAFRSILRAEMEEDVPPQNTRLGGQIGIHGVGRANALIHGEFDWTSGCIAMTDEQIDRLTPWVKMGTQVVIR
jgi:murein L,D-transpeptidase YafK